LIMVKYVEGQRQIRKRGDGIYWKEFNERIESVPMERFERALRDYFKKHGHL